MILYRRAAPDEIETIMSLVVRTFAGEQGIPEEMNYLPAKKEPRWYCAAEDGRIIGTVAFFREQGEWHAGRFALEPLYRGQHIGTGLVSYAFRDVFESGIREVVMEGRPATVHILTKLGAEITGEEFPFYSSTCTPMIITCEKFHTEKTENPDI
jgi:N-acetylglutamate synthase-like GNAT family acetyltransferase